MLKIVRNDFSALFISMDGGYAANRHRDMDVT